MLAASAAAIIGSVASWALIEQLLQSDFELDFLLVLLTTIAGAAATATLGLAGPFVPWDASQRRFFGKSSSGKLYPGKPQMR